ncbi:MAG: KpsF/GutQ family sugar-phosphate isomerase [Rhodospirillales bacterium]|jgi:arabinose-5-phosphate isomerase|nr:KpsF/GutQ family sugar-phosphate isomerase [Rhodospirillales bacterium]MBT4005830.1 KpsF/GutQ family sugar-phosphate isomerase [Rhodospirillales bacterium]MBT5075603.1 KpsF/GutQ family sugar-phosphate isomerase [Rhodospirillales bacterium]MBT5114115.1 KpsF/GutQ family sugar-phosphate isomerase [Rhodospirillales bacterium]MBT5672643.1 KpsF/GutQ family sugar-phosphate isomerase [Rhodospirillales bacterium]
MTAKPENSQPKTAPKTAPDSQTEESRAKMLSVARRVFEIEARGLTEAAQGLDDTFLDAVDKILNITGRLIVSGMGKSGHIAHKIAATLASTGTPSFFVHPAEASHGDLGMITRDDAVLAISNSGDTAELSDLIAYAKRFSIPLIGITTNPKSALADGADVLLALPNADEACPMGLAPTTSTTMTLALGDALAIALLEHRGFTPDQFQLLHPGGQLGRELLKISDIMHADDEIPKVAPDTTMSEVLITMTTKHFGCAGVLGVNNQLLGIITDGDLRRNMASGLLDVSAETVMTANPVTIASSALAIEALAIMNDKTITSLFVVDENEVVGIIHVHDLLHFGIA